VVKFVVYPSKLKKQPFFANNFKIQRGAKAPSLTPFRPMHSDDALCGDVSRRVGLEEGRAAAPRIHAHNFHHRKCSPFSRRVTALNFSCILTAAAQQM